MEVNNFCFKVVDVSYQNVSQYEDSDVDFYLEKDAWDDYHFHTTYHLHTAKGLYNKRNFEYTENKYLGPISIMKKGQKENEKFLLAQERFFSLPDDFCSLSLSIELFQVLAKLLNREERGLFIEALRLVLDNESEIYQKFKDEPCFNTSLLRDTDINNDNLKMAKYYMLDIGMVYNMRTHPLQIHLKNYIDKIELNFSSKSSELATIVPSNVSVFIGKNGCGKSSALYKIAKILYASPKIRYLLAEEIGEISPNDASFSRLIMISYSPFDNFLLPGTTSEEQKLIINGLERGDGRFIFCGIRDVKQEIENCYNKIDCIKTERLEKTILKDISVLGEEFFQVLEKIAYLDSSKEWNALVKRIYQFQPLLEICCQPFIVDGISEDKQEILDSFKILSTGHKFLLHSLANLLAYIEPNSMIIFDEPENHLHPPLLSFMLKEMRNILYKKESIMLIATHSPVVLQETFSHNIIIVRRQEGLCHGSNPIIQTFGENIGTITTEVFDLTTDHTSYHDIFDKLYDLWKCNLAKDENQVISIFEEKLNTRLSNQLCAYLINKKLSD